MNIKQMLAVSPSRVNAVCDTRKIASRGLIWIALLFGVFGVWAVLVPLSGAIVASGRVLHEANAQTVRHETGGVLSIIRVREGDKVKTGDTLIEFDNTQTKARLDQIDTRLKALSLRQRRLEAEISQTKSFDINMGPTDLMARDQNREFAIRQERRQAETVVLEAKRRALVEQRTGLKGQIKAIDTRRRAAAKQVNAFRKLARRGFGSKMRLWEVEQKLAETSGEAARLKAALGAINFQIAEAAGALARAGADFRERVANELTKIRAESLELTKQRVTAIQAEKRVALLAPMDGVVGQIHVHTLGSAVKAFDPLVDIVPLKQAIVIEARLNPIDIDAVVKGQPATVVLSAFNRNIVDPLHAEVTFVSPDSRTDSRTGEAYYIARLTIEKAAAAAPASIVPAITSGMPVEVFVKTRDRVFLDYLLSPVTESFARAFRS